MTERKLLGVWDVISSKNVWQCGISDCTFTTPIIPNTVAGYDQNKVMNDLDQHTLDAHALEVKP